MQKYEVLPSQALEAINENSLRVLEQVGVEFHYPEALEIFKEAGAEVRQGRVYLEERFVREMVAAAPASFKVRGRCSSRDVVLGDGAPVFSPGYGASTVMEGEMRRPATRKDFINLARLSGASSYQQVTGGILVDPSDVPEKTKYLWMVYDLLTNSDKPYLSIPYGKEVALDCIEMASLVFGGLKNIADDPVTFALVNSLTPLRYHDRMTGSLIEFARAGQPLIISAAAMAGASSPCTLAGTLVVQTAEILAGVVLAQLVRPGTPAVYGSASSVTDMRHGTISMGSSESALLQCASAQIAKSWGLPCRGSGFMTDSKSVDAQTGYESLFNCIFNFLGGADIIVHCAGILESTKVMSYQKFLIDDEVCGLIRRFSRGIEWDMPHLAFDIIKEQAHSGSFMTSEHTFKYFKDEFFQPHLFNKQSYDTWFMNGAQTMGSAADNRCQEILEEYKPQPLAAGVEKELLAFISKREKS